ncbi:MAG TPA: hypothetical protein VGN31_20480 [Paraburkholderia sp.]|jgi:hypothetical protein
MKRFVAVVLFASLNTFGTHATAKGITIGPLPAISNASPKLKKSLRALWARIESDAKECTENAKGMDSVANYRSSVKKMIETSKVVVLQVSASMICDGVHSSSYRYGIAFEKASGTRLDLSRVYNIATRVDGRLFIRPELVNSVKSSYRKASRDNQSCLSATGWEDEIANLPITFSPLPDGSIVLYYVAPDVSAACFPALPLEPEVFVKFRDANQASRYELP